MGEVFAIGVTEFAGLDTRSWELSSPLVIVNAHPQWSRNTRKVNTVLS